MTSLTFPDSADLARALTNALAHASTDKARPILAAVRLERTGAELLRIVSCDSYTLCIEEMPGVDVPEGDIEALIDIDDVKDMVRQLKAGNAAVSTLSFDGDTFTLSTAGAVTMTRRSVVGDYPPYRKLLPAAGDGSPVGAIGLGRGHLAKFAKMVPAVEMRARAKDKGNVPVRFELGETALKAVRFELGNAIYGCIMPVRLAPGTPA